MESVGALRAHVEQRQQFGLAGSPCADARAPDMDGAPSSAGNSSDRPRHVTRRLLAVERRADCGRKGGNPLA